MAWVQILMGALVFNAVLGLGYRIYRLRRGGPKADVVGQAILGALLVALALGLVLGAGWPRWPALIYGVVFGVVVMPVWVLAVLIPLNPGAPDYVFTATYWIGLGAIVISALLA